MSSLGDAQAIVDVATAAAAPTVLSPEERYAFVVPGGKDERGTVITVDPLAEKYLPAPRRISGSASVFDVDSLKILWDKYAGEHSELFGDEQARTLTAVLNADSGSDAPAFRDHRVTLACRLTPAWQAWARLDGQLGDQVIFAEHIENRIIDFVEPQGAEMLELAQTFEAKTKVDFKSAANLGSGQRALIFDETVQAKAGEKGQIEIPSTFVVAIQPFEGGDAYKVTARLRFRIRENKLFIGYSLERPEDVLRDAFKSVCEKASHACDRPVLMGSAFGSR